MRNKLRLFLPTIADLLFVIPFLCLSFYPDNGLLEDGDTGYHIRAGEFILNTLSIPRHDIFSFLSPPIPWTAHEWLSEVIMAIVHMAFGLTGVVIFFAFLISLVYYLLYRMNSTSKNNVILAILVTLLVMVSSTFHWLARPHIFSLIVFVVWYFILNAYHYRNKSYLYLLPLLMVLWVNLHGGFIAGFILLGVYLIGNVIQSFSSETGKRGLSRKRTATLAFVIVLCLLATLINPNGYHILLFPFNLVSNTFLMDHVTEFISPNFHEIVPFKYLLLLMISLFAVSRERLDGLELLLVLIFTNMALYSERHITLFAIISLPIILRQGEALLHEKEGAIPDFLKKRSNVIASVDKTAAGYVWPVVGVLIVIFFAANGKLEYTFDAKKKPVAAVEFLKTEPIQGNMFNNDEFGDYIIFAAWPNYRVFSDGRSDMYGVERMKDYFKVIYLETGWETVLEKYDINWIIYNSKSILSRVLIKDKGWRLIYSDKVATIFVRNVPEYQYLIERYQNVTPLIE
jgi:hypothetical protein